MSRQMHNRAAKRIRRALQVKDEHHERWRERREAIREAKRRTR